ncbi:MAG: ROK family protein [Spirochaetaceae bacterium]|jgi:glucokinase|nr:ROK family protein [Spirochaetaceae bacterium]
MNTIGIDIGGTLLRAAVFNEDFAILDRTAFPNDRNAGAEANAGKLAAFILDAAGGPESAGSLFKGIGIGCPGPLDFRAGKVLNPPNLYGWNGFEIVRFFEEKTGLRTVLTNDANAAGLAEARLGAGKGCESVFYITVSTGVGGAYIYRGELVSGAHSAAAEIYDLIVCEDPWHHKGANPGSLNETCGGDALARQAAEAFGRPVDAKELYEDLYLVQRHPEALRIVERALDNIAKGIGNIACTVDPDLFIFGGSIALHSPGFLEKLEERARLYMIDPAYLRISVPRFGGDAGLIGAALLLS